jgi:hypothetical protein
MKMDKLNILWSTDNKHTIDNLLAMYSINSKAYGWWDKINVIIWGASAKLIGADKKYQNLVKEMIDSGISVEACKVCSDNLNASNTLSNLGVDVKYMGEQLTKYLKSDEKMLTI